MFWQVDGFYSVLRPIIGLGRWFIHNNLPLIGLAPMKLFPT
jgi:hypothetical protein